MLAIVLFALVTCRAALLLLRTQRQAEALEIHAGELRTSLDAQQGLQNDLRYQAFHDALTGLANRALFRDRVEQALNRANRDRQLKGLGVRIAIDDFGTGYASLSYLRNFPVDVIKIDKSFIDPLAHESGATDMFLAGICTFAHDLQLTLVAEGIEHPAQRDALIALGCDRGQGYLMSRPLPESAALALVEATRPLPMVASIPLSA